MGEMNNHQNVKAEFNQPEMHLAILNDSTVHNVEERTLNQEHNEVLKDTHVIDSERSEPANRDLEYQDNNNGEDSELHVVGDEQIGESTSLIDELTGNIEEIQAYQNDERTESNEVCIVFKDEPNSEIYVGLENPGLPGSSMPSTDDVLSASEESHTKTVFCGLQEDKMLPLDTGNSAINKDRETDAKVLNSILRKDLKGQSLRLKVLPGNDDSQSEGSLTNPKHQLQKSKFHDIPLIPCPDGMKRDIDAVCDMKEIERFNWRIAPELPVPKYNITVALLTDGQTFKPLLDIMTKIADGNAPGQQVTMRYELLRICTLRNYPKDNKPYLIQLAAAGFYYAGDGDEVICYCCGLRRHSWVGTDVPERIHCRINPKCKFLNRKLEFNVPVAFTGTTANLEKLEKLLTMLNEEPELSSRAVTAEGGNNLSEYAPANPSARVGYATNNERETDANRWNRLWKKGLKGKNLRLKVVIGNNDSQSDGPLTNSKHLLQKSKFHDIPLRLCQDGMKRQVDAVCDMKEIERFNWRIAPVQTILKYNITVALLIEGKTCEPLLDIITRIADAYPPGPQVTMRYELLRIGSLRNYPKDNKPYLIQLAAAGFYYAGDGDEVICYCCGLRRHSWVATDVPETIHRRINPNFKFLNRKHEFNIPVAFTGTSANLEKLENVLTMLNEEPELSISAVTAERGNDLSEFAPVDPSFRGGALIDLGSPKHPQHILKSERISSFQGWPDSLAHTPEIMAEAGFYYAGFGDCVRCYYCGIGLRHWAQEDNPWIEHARWSKNCAFINSVKGEEFVHLVQMAVQNTPNEEGNQAIGTSEESSEQAAENTPSERELVDNILKSDPAQSVLDMGYQPKMIKKAIEFILKRDGRPGISSQTIMEKVLEYEEAESNTNIGGELANMDLNRHDHPSGEAEAESIEKNASKVNESEDKCPKQSEARTFKEENKKMKEQMLCKVCLDKPVRIVFLPCGHLCTCDSCAPAIRSCPICKTDVKRTVKTNANS